MSGVRGAKPHIHHLMLQLTRKRQAPRLAPAGRARIQADRPLKPEPVKCLVEPAAPVPPPKQKPPSAGPLTAAEPTPPPLVLAGSDCVVAPGPDVGPAPRQPRAKPSSAVSVGQVLSCRKPEVVRRVMAPVTRPRQGGEHRLSRALEPFGVPPMGWMKAEDLMSVVRVLDHQALHQLAGQTHADV